jgi:heme-degrading monooxygenase HmoA
MSRDSRLDKVPGFVAFHLLKGPEAEDHTLYTFHTVWAVVLSEAFRAGQARPFRSGHARPSYQRML